MATSSLIKTFQNRLVELDKATIFRLNEADHTGAINNVLIGLDRHVLSLALKDDISETKTDFRNVPYQLIYINGASGELKGYLFTLRMNLKERNELLFLFCKHLSEEFEPVNRFNLFNAYQKFTQTIFEKLGYITYTDNLLRKVGRQHADFVLKGPGVKGLVYTPFIEEWKLTEPISTKKTNSQKVNVDDETFVYLMLNRANGRYKIGRSKFPFFREKTLQSQEPDVELIDKWLAPSSVEKKLHRLFKDKRLRGEWFELSKEDISTIRITMVKYSPNTTTSNNH